MDLRLAERNGILPLVRAARVAAVVLLAVSAFTALLAVQGLSADYAFAPEFEEQLEDSHEAAHSWTSRPHPAREATGTVLIDGSGDELDVSGEWAFALNPADPLLEAIQAGELDDGSSILQYVAGIPSAYSENAPTVQYSDTGLATVRVSADLFYYPSTTEERQLIIPLEEAPSNNHVDESYDGTYGVNEKDDLARVRTLNLRFVDLAAAAVIGERPKRQDRESLLFVGPPARSLSIELLPNENTSSAVARYFADDDDSYFVDESFVYWPATMLFPWLAFLLLGRRSKNPVVCRLKAVCTVMLVSVPIIGTAVSIREANFSASILTTISIVGGGFLLLSAPIGLIALSRTGNRSLLSRFHYSAYSIAALTAILSALVPNLSAWPLSRAVAVVALIALSTSATACAALVAGGRLWVLPGLLIGLSAAAGSLLLSMLYSLREGGAPGGLIVSTIIGLCLAPPIYEVLHRSLQRRRIIGLYAALLGIVAIVPLSPLFSSDLTSITNTEYWQGWPLAGGPVPYAVTWLTAANLGLVIICVSALRRYGQDRRSWAKPETFGAGVAMVLLSIYDYPGHLEDLLAVVIATAGLLWLTRGGFGPVARRLALVNSATHERLLRIEERRRITSSAVTDFHKSAKQRLGSGDLTLEEFVATSSRLQPDSRGLGSLRHGRISIRLAAFNSSGGSSPWRNGTTAAAAGLIVALPAISYELWYIFGRDAGPRPQETVWVLNDLRNVIRWPAYAFFFGYFYPAIRGRGPVAKAASLFLVLLGPEMMTVLADRSDSLGPTVTTLAIRASQLLVLSMGIGLYWERRLALAGQLSWGRLRNFRSLRSLAVPVSTVLAAVLTAVATAVATAAIGPLVQPSSPTAPPASPPSVPSTTPPPK